VAQGLEVPHKLGRSRGASLPGSVLIEADNRIPGLDGWQPPTLTCHGASEAERLIGTNDRRSERGAQQSHSLQPLRRRAVDPELGLGGVAELARWPKWGHRQGGRSRRDEALPPSGFPPSLVTKSLCSSISRHHGRKEVWETAMAAAPNPPGPGTTAVHGARFDRHGSCLDICDSW
jgi:hypothetical protein